jgi:predicted nucleotidyltransferase
MTELRSINTRAWLFGSVARGEANRQSDIDILIDGQFTRDISDPLAARLTILVRREVQVVGSRVLVDDPDELFVFRFKRDAIRLHSAKPWRPEWPAELTLSFSLATSSHLNARF